MCNNFVKYSDLLDRNLPSFKSLDFTVITLSACMYVDGKIRPMGYEPPTLQVCLVGSLAHRIGMGACALPDGEWNNHVGLETRKKSYIVCYHIPTMS